ncbi:MAG: hypothetical protein LH609_13580, partial [Rudanella sp.]|nr:hypothetical protein [Rudanella sp.]
LSIKPTSQVPADDVLKPFEGQLKRVEGKGFGFVNDVFITPILLNCLPVGEESFVAGTALLSFDKVKSAYGWKAITLSGMM